MRYAAGKRLLYYGTSSNFAGFSKALLVEHEPLVGCYILTSEEKEAACTVYKALKSYAMKPERR